MVNRGWISPDCGSLCSRCCCEARSTTYLVEPNITDTGRESGVN